MKRKLLLLISLMAAVIIIGCSKAPAEKEPVVVADKITETTTDLSTSDTENSDNSGNANISGILGISENTDISLNAPDEALSENNGNTDAETSEKAVPRKLTLTIEGTQEEYMGIDYHSKLGYRITYDMDRFSITDSDDGQDYFLADNTNPELYPYVYMKISRNDKPPLENSEGTDVPYFAMSMNGETNEITPEYSSDVKIAGYNAKLYHFISGSDWNSSVNNFYMIEHGDYIYEIWTQTYLEAEEGYGARIQAMLDTFTFE